MYVIDFDGNVASLTGGNTFIASGYFHYESRVALTIPGMEFDGAPSEHILHQGTRTECEAYRDWLIGEMAQVAPVFQRPDISSTKEPKPEPVAGNHHDDSDIPY